MSNGAPFSLMFVVAAGCLIISSATHIAHEDVRNSPRYSKEYATILALFEKIAMAGFAGTIILMLYYAMVNLFTPSV